MDNDNSLMAGSPERPKTIGPPPVPRVACRKCGRIIDVTNAFCPHCGERQGSGEVWYYRPGWILVLALLAIGPLALPLVWKTPKMSRAEKLVMAVAIVVYTGCVVYFFIKIFQLELQYIRDFESVMRRLEAR